ncbi:acid phosphatase-domain-containing protein [Xylaria curta]|nr:acid phosphatase-domain-containing protein [Xylaria curta]
MPLEFNTYLEEYRYMSQRIVISYYSLLYTINIPMGSMAFNQSYPSIVAFDLDGTFWRGWLNEHWIGQKGLVSHDLRDNLTVKKCKGDMIIRDQKNEDFQCIVASDIIKIIQDLRKHRVAIAIVSRNTNKNLTDRALWLIKIPEHRETRPLTELLKYDEVKDVSKMEHFHNIKRASGVKYKDMILFDDKLENVDVELWQGVTFAKVDTRSGITWNDYNSGLNQWRRYQAIRFSIPQSKIKSLRARLIGYVGADEASAMRYQKGKRRLKSNRASRWGHGIYVTDNPHVAEFFAKWGREDNLQNQYVVSIYTRDWDAFQKLEKVWVPERGTFNQINNLNQTDEKTAKCQYKLDKQVMGKFNVKKPFILFSRHHRMEDMEFLPEGTRFNEMVLYPNVQDALFFGEPFPIAKFVADMDKGLWKDRGWHRRMKEYNIGVIPETTKDFKAHNENMG